MKILARLIVVFLLPAVVCSQSITWEDVSSNYEFPAGLKLMHGTMEGNSSFFAWYYEVDLSSPDIAIRPYLRTNSAQVHDFSAEVGAYGAINGGFFSGGSSVSSIIYPGVVAARNITAVTRTVGGITQSYPVIRPVFALHNDRTLAARWVYHHSLNFDDIYIYDNPLDYACDDPNPSPAPLKANGYVYEDIAYGLGGGPMLIKDGQIDITYCEEVFWGSGVYLTDYRPRTAVGYTSDQKVIMFVTNHMMIAQMAEVLHGLGCYEAINLDGGGSTAIAAGDVSIYDQNRAVPSILAVVHTDSLDIPAVPVYEKFMSTSDEGVTSQGSWFATANEGFWQDPSMLHALASHDEYFDFPLNLPGPGEYEIYGWWTSHANRAADTPYFITHADGVSEVAVNQSVGGSMWNLIGTFNFSGTPDEAVRITAGATTNQYVVADGLRIVSYSLEMVTNEITSIAPVEDIEVPRGTTLEEALALLSSETTITDKLNQTYMVALQWSADNYDGANPGDYAAIALFELPEGVEQTDPPTPLEVHATITVLDDTSVAAIEAENLLIFPNPNTGSFVVEGTLSGNWNVKLMTLDGKMVYEGWVNGLFSMEINLGDDARGIYLLRITGDHFTKVHKVLVK